MESVTITIGRGVGTTGRTLPAAAWNEFRSAIREVCESAGYEVTAHATGYGEWDGVTEENSVTVGIRDEWGPWDHATVRRNLAELAAGYRQDAIACAFGSSDLVLAAGSGQVAPFSSYTVSERRHSGVPIEVSDREEAEYLRGRK